MRPHDPTLDAPLSAAVQQVGPARLLRRLGMGASGSVFEAVLEEDTAYGARSERVAVKILHPELRSSEHAIARLATEARLGAAVNDPRVARIHEAGIAAAGTTSHHYLVMELVEGRSLSALFRELRVVPEPLLRDVARQVALGLAAIHAQGAVHRDLKPANVVITPDHHVKVLDLGIARVLDDAARLTAAGGFAGSPEYASPEQFEGGDVGPSADLYALGVILLEGATGTNPFRADSPAASMRRHAELVPPRASEVRPDISAFLDELVACLLAKSPEDRPGSAAELADTLASGESSEWWAVRARESAAPDVRASLARLRARRDTGFVGRAEALAQLQELASRAASGTGAVLVIEGDAGLGKTRLVDEMLRTLPAERGALRVLCSGGVRGGTSDLGPAGEMIAGAFAPQRIEAELVARLGESSHLAPALASLLHPPPGRPPQRVLSAEVARAALISVIESLAREAPLLVIVDDLHAQAPSSLGDVVAVARLTARLPVALVATSEPGASTLRLLAAAPGATMLTLAPLTAEDVTALVTEALGGSLVAPQVAERVAQQCGGNPFLALEMLAELEQRGVLARRPGGWWALQGELGAVEAPTSLRGALLARLAAVPSRERALLEVCALGESGADPAVVADVLGRSELAVLEDLAALASRSGLLRPAGRAFVFEHEIIRDVLARSLAADDARDLHRAHVDALARRRAIDLGGDAPVTGADALALLKHVLAGGVREHVRRVLRPALEHAAATSRLEEIPRLIDDAVALLDDAGFTERAGLLRAKAQAMKLVGIADERLVEAGEAALRACADDTDPAVRRQIEVSLATYLQIAGQDARAGSAALDALRDAREAGDARTEWLALDVLGGLAASRGDMAEARTLHEQALQTAHAASDIRGQLLQCQQAGFACLQLGDGQAALALHDQQLHLAEELGDAAEIAGARDGRGHALHRMGRLDEARAECVEALALARKLGRVDVEGRALNHLGLVLADLGDHRGARECHERRLRLARDMGRRDSEAVALVNLGEAARGAGDLADARAFFEAAHGLCLELSLQRVLPYALDGMASLADDSPEARREALAQLEESLRLRREQGAIAATVEPLAIKARLLRESDPAAAAACLAEARGLVERLWSSLPAEERERLWTSKLEGVGGPTLRHT